MIKETQTTETMTSLQKRTVNSMFLNVKKQEPDAILTVSKVGFAGRISVTIVLFVPLKLATYREFYALCELSKTGNIVWGKFNKYIPIKEDEIPVR